MDRAALKVELERMRAGGASDDDLRAFVRKSASPQEIFSPGQRRELSLELETLRKDGYGDEELRDYVKGFKDGYTSPGTQTAIAPFADNFMFSYGDEAKGVVQSMVTGRGRLYETAKARGEYARGRKDRPTQSLLEGTAGAVLSGVGTGVGAAGLVGRGATMLGRIGRAAGTGAVEGAIAGAGQEVGGANERIGGAGTGAAFGGVIGGAASPAADAGRFVANRAAAAFSGAGGEHQASRLLRDALEGSNGNEVNIPARMRQSQAEGVPTTFAETIGRQGVDLLEGAAQAPGKGGENIYEHLGNRQVGQNKRVVGGLQRHSGVTGGSLDTKLATAQARGDTAGPLYDDLRGIDLPDDLMGPLRQIISTEAGRKAYRYAAQLAEQEAARTGVNRMPKFDELVSDGRITVAEADRILQGFEGVGQKKMTPGAVPGTMQNTAESREYNKTAQWLRDKMKARVPEFAKAREAWAGPSQLIEGVGLGEKAVGKMPADTFKTTWDRASSAQQEGMRIGLINALKNNLEQFTAGPMADATRTLHGQYAIQEKLRIALGRKAADDFLAQVGLEAKGSENARRVLGNSATARRLGIKEMMETEQPGNVPTTMGEVLKRVWGKLDQAANQRTYEAIARFGLEDDPDRAAALAQQLLSSTAGRPRSGITGAAVGGPAGAAGASITDDRNRRY